MEFQEPKPDDSRVIISLDFDCFYASVALLTRPHLRDKPVGIKQKHLLVTTNYVARGLGVKKMSTVNEALQKCPSIEIIDGSDLQPFRAANKTFIESIITFFNTKYPKHEYKLEKLGLDEVFIDVTGIINDNDVNIPWKFEGFVHSGTTEQSNNSNTLSDHLYTSLAKASFLANELRTFICEFTKGLTCCAGISTSKLLSKLVANLNKPNKQTSLLVSDYAQFVSAYTLEKLPGLGRSIIQVFENHSTDYKCVGDLAKDFPVYTKSLFEASIQRLSQVFYRNQHIYKSAITQTFIVKILLLLHGIDNSPVIHHVANLSSISMPSKSISVEDAFRSCKDFQALKQSIIHPLVSRFMVLLVDDYESERRRAQTLSVGFRKVNDGFKSTWKSRKAPVELVGTKLSRNNAHAISKVKQAIVSRIICVLKEDANIHQASTSIDLKLVGVAVSNFKLDHNMRPPTDLQGQQSTSTSWNSGASQQQSNRPKSKGTMDISSFFSKKPSSSSASNRIGRNHWTPSSSSGRESARRTQSQSISKVSNASKLINKK